MKFFITIVMLVFCFVVTSAYPFTKEDVDTEFREYAKLVPPTIFTSNVAVGGIGDVDGKQFYCNSENGSIAKNGSVVLSLKAWYYIERIVAIQVGLSDGTNQTFGKPAHQISETFVIASGEKITSLKIWPSYYNNDGRLGAFELMTDQKRLFNVTGGKFGDPYEPELGSGVLVGVYGKISNDDEITNFGFALLRRGTIQLTNVTYPNIDITQDMEPRPKEVQTITYNNSNSDEDQNFTFRGSTTVTKSQSWSIGGSIVSNTEVKVHAGIPLFSADAKTSLTISVKGSYNRSNTQTTSQSYEFPLTVPKHICLKATAVLNEGNLDIIYKGVVVFTLDTGAKLSYNVTGVYSGISVSSVIVSVTHL